MNKEKAVQLSNTNWWKDIRIDQKDIVGFQLYEERLCMDFDTFVMACEDVFEQPIFDYQLGDDRYLKSLKNRFESNYNPEDIKYKVLNMFHI